jgi:hypothetical protein
MNNLGANIFAAFMCVFISQTLISKISADELNLIQNNSENLKESLLKLNERQLNERKTKLAKQVEELSVTKSETQNPHTNKKLTTQLKEIIEELELIEQILLATVGLNIILGDSNDSVGLGAGNASSGNSGTGTGTGG